MSILSLDFAWLLSLRRTLDLWFRACRAPDLRVQGLRLRVLGRVQESLGGLPSVLETSTQLVPRPLSTFAKLFYIF